MLRHIQSTEKEKKKLAFGANWMICQVLWLAVWDQAHTCPVCWLYKRQLCRYDDMKTAQENIDLQTTILSRFDLIFIVKDERSMDRDKQIARHVLNVHKNAGAALEVDEEEKKVSGQT